MPNKEYINNIQTNFFSVSKKQIYIEIWYYIKKKNIIKRNEYIFS
jgi:hypothetical protein